MLDITAPRHVSVQVSDDNRTLWINVDGRCVLRCWLIEHLDILSKGSPTPNSVLSADANIMPKMCPKHQVTYETAQCPICAAGMG